MYWITNGRFIIGIKSVIFLSLVNNIALLVSLSVVNNFILRRWKQNATVYQIFSGLLYGIVAVIGMMNPLKLLPGIFFDGRSIVISIAGLFGGPIAALIAVVIAATYRIWLGGAGTFIGICVISESAALGVAYHYIRRRYPQTIQPLCLLGFGILVHLIMVALISSIIGGVTSVVFGQLVFPVMFIYPLATLLVCLLLLDQESRLKAEEAVRQNNALLNAILNTTPLPIVYINVDSVFEDCNKAFMEFVGRSREEIVGTTPYSLVSRKTANLYHDVIQQLFKQGGDLMYETTMRHADHSMRDVIIYLSVVANKSDQNIGIVGVILDITERKQAEEQTRLYSRNLEIINDAVSQLVGNTDEAKIYQIIGEAVHKLLPDTYYFITAVTSNEKHLYITDSYGFESQFKTIKKILRLDPYSLKIPFKNIPDDELALYTSGKLFYAMDGLYMLSVHAVPKPVCKSIEKLLGVSEIYCIGFTCDEIPYGGLTILLRKGQSIQPTEVIETMINQASIAIQRKRTEEKLKEKTEELERYFTSSLDLFCIADTKGIFRRLNSEWKNCLGYEVSDLIGKQLFDFIHPDDVAATQATVTALSAGNDVLNFVNRYRAKDGSYRWIEWRSRPVGDLIYAAARDITERKQIGEALRESEARFQMLVENAPDAIFVQTAGLFAYLNPAALRLFKAKSPEDLLGKPLIERVDPSYRDRVTERIRLLIEKKIDVGRDEEIYLTMDGNPVDVEVLSVPIFYQGQYGSLVFPRDISERKNMQRVLIENEKLAGIGTLAAGIAHEINSPLQVITGLSENASRWLENGSVNTVELQRRFNNINNNAWRIAAIVRSLLDYSHSTTEMVAICSINDLIKKTLLLVEHQLLSWSNITITTILAENLPTVSCDINQITQVLINLLTNARDAMPDGGEIAIQTSYDQPSNKIFLRVSDTGVGISEDIRRKIFDPFFTTKPVGKGTGLGLSITSGILRGHGGDIELESTSNCGSVFKISLPINTSLPEKNDETNVGRY